jgi:Family of unknown function (DUF5681)
MPDEPSQNVESGVESNKMLGGCTGKGFMPGQSGNPGGKPRKPASERLIRRLLANDEKELAEVIEALVAKAKGGDVPALKEVLDRAEGKVADKVESSGPDGGEIQTRLKIQFIRSK